MGYLIFIVILQTSNKIISGLIRLFHGANIIDNDEYGEQYFDKANSRYSELIKDIFEECQDSKCVIRRCNPVIHFKSYYTRLIHLNFNNLMERCIYEFYKFILGWKH